jgi:predicted nucleotidyltransferase component of viral defense system
LTLIKELKIVLTAHDFLEVKESFESDFTIKINRLRYVGPLVNANSLKIEIDFAQNVVLAPRDMEYRNVYGVETLVRVMDLREILAEKVRAASGRARYRDFYDIAMIFESHSIDVGEILDLVRQKEIRETISQESMLKNWEIAKLEKEKGVDLIVYTNDIPEEKILESIKKIGPFEITKTS